MNLNPSPALSVISALGLIEVTTDKQLRNGTRMFFDPVTKLNYASYSKGYVRRLYSTPFYGKNREMMMYPLNPREMKSHVFSFGVFELKGYRLIHDPVRRLELIARAASNHREYRKKLEKKS